LHLENGTEGSKISEGDRDQLGDEKATSRKQHLVKTETVSKRFSQLVERPTL
jgi:hypothetical protein